MLTNPMLLEFLLGRSHVPALHDVPLGVCSACIDYLKHDMLLTPSHHEAKVYL